MTPFPTCYTTTFALIRSNFHTIASLVLFPGQTASSCKRKFSRRPETEHTLSISTSSSSLFPKILSKLLYCTSVSSNNWMLRNSRSTRYPRVLCASVEWGLHQAPQAWKSQRLQPWRWIHCPRLQSYYNIGGLHVPVWRTVSSIKEKCQSPSLVRERNCLWSCVSDIN
jgi:hypothetical protein